MTETKHKTTPDEVFESESIRHTSGHSSKSPFTGAVIGALVAVLAIGGIGGFVAGLQVGKGSTSATASQAGGPGGMNNGNFPGGGMRMGTMGTVTAISADSITVEDQFQGDSTTFTITSDTEITDDGETASISDIQEGDSVRIRTSSSSSSDSDSSSDKTATAIELNPTMGGPGGQTQSSSDSSSSSSSSSI